MPFSSTPGEEFDVAQSEAAARAALEQQEAERMRKAAEDKVAAEAKKQAETQRFEAEAKTRAEQQARADQERERQLAAELAARRQAAADKTAAERREADERELLERKRKADADAAAEREESARVAREALKPISQEEKTRILSEKERAEQAAVLRRTQSGVAGVLEEREVAKADKPKTTNIEDEIEHQRNQTEEAQRRAREEIAAHEAAVADYNKRQNAVAETLKADAKALDKLDGEITTAQSDLKTKADIAAGRAPMTGKTAEEVSDADIARVNKLIDDYNQRAAALNGRSTEAVKKLDAEAATLNQRAGVINERNAFRQSDIETEARRLMAKIDAANFRSERAYKQAVETAETRLAARIATGGVEKREAQIIAKQEVQQPAAVNTWSSAEGVWVSPEGNRFIKGVWISPEGNRFIGGIWHSPDDKLRFVGGQWVPAQIKTLGTGEERIQEGRSLVTTRQGTQTEMAEPPLRTVKTLGTGEERIQEQRFIGPGGPKGAEVAEPKRPDESAIQQQVKTAEIAAPKTMPVAIVGKEIEGPLTKAEAQANAHAPFTVFDLSGKTSGNSTMVVAHIVPTTPEEDRAAQLKALSLIPVAGTVVGSVQLAKGWHDLSTGGKALGVGLNAFAAAGDVLLVGKGASLAVRGISEAAKGGKVATEIAIDVATPAEAAKLAETVAKGPDQVRFVDTGAARASAKVGSTPAIKAVSPVTPSETARARGPLTSIEVQAAAGARASDHLAEVIRLNPPVSEIRVITGSPIAYVKPASQAASEVSKTGPVDIRSVRVEPQVAGRLPNIAELKAADRILGDLKTARADKLADATVTQPEHLKAPAIVVMSVERAPTPTEVKTIAQAIADSKHIDHVKIETHNPAAGAAAEIKFKAVNDAAASHGLESISRADFAKAEGAAGPKSVAEIVRDTSPAFQKETIGGSSRGDIFAAIDKEHGTGTPTARAIAKAETEAAAFERGAKQLTRKVDQALAFAESTRSDLRGPGVHVERVDTGIRHVPDEHEPEIVRRVRITDEPGEDRKPPTPESRAPERGSGGGSVTVKERTNTPVVEAVSYRQLATRTLTVARAEPRIPGLPVRPVSPAHPGGVPRAPETMPAPSPSVRTGEPQPAPARPAPVPAPEPIRTPAPGRQTPQPERSPSEHPTPVTTPRTPAPNETPSKTPNAVPTREPGHTTPAITEPAKIPEPKTVPGTHPGNIPKPTTSPIAVPTRVPVTAPAPTPSEHPMPGREPAPVRAPQPAPTPKIVPSPSVSKTPAPTPALIPISRAAPVVIPTPKPTPAPQPAPQLGKARAPTTTDVGIPRVISTTPARHVQPRIGEAVKYRPPADKPYPKQVVFGRGITQERVFLDSGRKEFGKHLNASIPDTPTKRPQDTFLIERWGKTPIGNKVITEPLFRAVIDPETKTITFVRRTPRVP